MDLDDYYIGKIPLPPSESVDKQFFKRTVSRLIDLNKNITLLTSDLKKVRLQDEIKFLESKINMTLYQYYNLSKADIAIIETTM